MFFSSSCLPVFKSYEIDFLFRSSILLFYCYCFACVSVKPRCFEVFFVSLWSFDIMASKIDLRSHFAKLKSSSQKDKPKASYLIQSVSNITGETENNFVQ